MVSLKCEHTMHVLHRLRMLYKGLRLALQQPCHSRMGLFPEQTLSVEPNCMIVL